MFAEGMAITMKALDGALASALFIKLYVAYKFKYRRSNAPVETNITGRGKFDNIICYSRLYINRYVTPSIAESVLTDQNTRVLSFPIAPSSQS